MLNSFLSNLRNVNHSFLARSKFDESTKFLNAYNCYLQESLPSSKSVTIVLMYLRALSIISLSTPHTETIPSSVMSILTPVSSIMALITLPLCTYNITNLMQDQSGSGSIFGAYAPTVFTRFSNCRLHTCIHNE